MRFLVDAQLPPALARWLSSAGHDAEHVMDCGLLDAPDQEIWEYAAAVGSIIITKDEGFSLQRLLARSGPSVIWIHLGNTRKSDLLLWFEPLLPELLKKLEQGETLLEVR